MDEAEWWQGTNPYALLFTVKAPQRERKLGLFVCACWRGIWHHISSCVEMASLEKIEERIDGPSPDEPGHWRDDIVCLLELKTVDLVWDKDTGQFQEVWAPGAAEVAAVQMISTEALDFWDSGRSELEAVRAAMKAEAEGQELAAAWDRQQRYQCHLLRDLFGNPFRASPTIPRAWLSWRDSTIVRMATAIYEERRFTDLPILADALEEAGCDETELLGHLRGPGPHVRGCWPLDWVLGKA